MSNVYIIDAVRTPIGAYLGQFKKTESVDLGISCVKGLLDRNSKISIKDIEGLVLGQVLTSGLGMNTARQVALGSGMHESSFAYVVNQVCGSGMRAAIDGSLKIFTSESDLILAGGQENMSRARHAYLSRTGETKLGNNIFIDLSTIQHGYYVKVLGISNPSAVDHFDRNTQLFSHCRSFFTPSVNQYFGALYLGKVYQKGLQCNYILNNISSNFDHRQFIHFLKVASIRPEPSKFYFLTVE